MRMLVGVIRRCLQQVGLELLGVERGLNNFFVKQSFKMFIVDIYIHCNYNRTGEDRNGHLRNQEREAN